MKKKVFVIDDGYSNMERRGIVYESILGEHFDVVNVFCDRQFWSRLESSTPDLYIVDVVLDQILDPSTTAPLETISVVRKLKKDIPVVFISSRYSIFFNDTGFTPFLNQLTAEGIMFKTFYTWKQFKEATFRKNIELRRSIIANIEFHIQSNEANRRTASILEKEYDFGVITALEEEMAPFKECLNVDFETVSVCGFEFLTCKINRVDGTVISMVLAVQQEMGMVDAAILGACFVLHFKVRKLIMIGVCGGRKNKNCKPISVVVPKKSVAYQGGKLEGSRFIFDAKVSQCSPDISSAVTNNSRQIRRILASIKSKVEKDHFKKYGRSLGLGTPLCITDPMACGDIIISKKGEIDRIAKATSNRKLCSVEMESYAILRLNSLFKTTSVAVMKGVMDDSEYKNDKFKEPAAYISANLLFQLIFNRIL